MQLKGSKTTPQADLLVAAIRICRLKLNNNAFQLPGQNIFLGPVLPQVPGGDVGAIPIKITYRIDMYKNVVSVSVEALTGVPRGRVSGIVWTNNRNMVDTPGSSPDYTPPYDDRGSASLLLQAAAYFDPNLVNNRLGDGVEGTENNPPTGVDGENVQMRQGLQPGQAGATGE